MSKSHVTAQSAFGNLPTENGFPVGRAATFVCPHANCRTYALQHVGYVQSLTVNLGRDTTSNRPLGSTPVIALTLCTACNQESVFIGGELARPASSEAPPPASDMPTALLADYEEASAILPKSPRGSSALLRLLIQKLLPILGTTKKDINAGIAELVAIGKIKVQIQQALDTVRVIGNECVHPGEMDLKDDHDTALALFQIVNLIIETEITEPKRLNELYETLPKSKREGIEQRDNK